MINRHKPISAMLCMLLLAALLAGCAGGGPSASAPSTSSAPSASSAPVASGAAATASTPPDAPPASPYQPDPETVYEIYAISSSVGPTDEEAIMKKVWEEQFNVKFNIVYIDGNFDEVMNLRFAGNDIPDVMATRTNANLVKYVEQQLIAPIPEDLAQAYLPNFLSQLEIEYPGALRYGYVDDTLYGMPTEVRSHNQFRTPIVWRGDWLEKFGYQPGAYPETLEQWREVLTHFAKDDPDGNGSNDTYGLSADGFAGIFGAFGAARSDAWVDDGTGKLINTSVQPGTKDALAFLAELYREGVIDPEFLTGENKGGYWALSHAFIEGRIGMTSRGSYYHWCSPATFPAAQNYIEIQMATPGVEEKLVYGQPPVGPNGVQGITKASELSQSFMVFGIQLAEDLPKMAKIMQIQDYFCTDTDTYLSAYYGKEGEFWQWDADQVPEALDAYIDPKAMAQQGAHYSIVMLSLKRDHDVVGKRLVEWARNLGMDQHGVENQLAVTTPAAARSLAELNTLRDPIFNDIIMGNQPIDAFDGFVEQWLSMGGQEWIDEANAWYETIK